MIRWEYKSYLFERDDKVIEKFNSLGNEGWEAFQFMQAAEGRLRVYFKRQKADQPKEQS